MRVPARSSMPNVIASLRRVGASAKCCSTDRRHKSQLCPHSNSPRLFLQVPRKQNLEGPAEVRPIRIRNSRWCSSVGSGSTRRRRRRRRRPKRRSTSPPGSPRTLLRRSGSCSWSSWSRSAKPEDKINFDSWHLADLRFFLLQSQSAHSIPMLLTGWRQDSNPRQSELRPARTFKGRSTDWATALRLADLI